ncbi:expressed unknown protein [Seminavis robusta]|uniref:Uncharacterized protein n=1 Tax=Seminavis robusta TaxID=568900 RepID=A0A9N8H251_9STRA|nr:expressed unknown protein [Seminavis robusta]|eukprot:Sro12_g009650.1 n/a (78) ;mRNA; r:195576-195941
MTAATASTNNNAEAAGRFSNKLVRRLKTTMSNGLTLGFLAGSRPQDDQYVFLFEDMQEQWESEFHVATERHMNPSRQ